MSDYGITIERIRERAYDIWDRNHRPEGFDVEFWLMAERELRAEAAVEAPVRRNDGGEDVSP
jgi:hypothetical protein